MPSGIGFGIRCRGIATVVVLSPAALTCSYSSLATVGSHLVLLWHGRKHAAADAVCAGAVAFGVVHCFRAAWLPVDALANEIETRTGDMWGLFALAICASAVLVGSQARSLDRIGSVVGAFLLLYAISANVIYTRTGDARVLTLLLPTMFLFTSLGALIGARLWKEALGEGAAEIPPTVVEEHKRNKPRCCVSRPQRWCRQPSDGRSGNSS